MRWRSAAQPGEWIVTMPVGDPPNFFGVPDGLAEKRYPNRWDLDEAAPDNPVYIKAIWGPWRHILPLVSIANSKALEAAGITAATRAALSVGRDREGRRAAASRPASSSRTPSTRSSS